MGPRVPDELTPELLREAYARGFFPMGDPRTGEILWFHPDPRTVIPLDRFKPSRAVRAKLRRGRFRVSFNEDFAGVVDSCADRESTWITPKVRDAYLALHREGGAVSVEAWDGGLLAGGVYGVRLGGAFMAESMFHRVPDAGMVALAALVERLKAEGFRLFDVQYPTPHLERLGAVSVPRAEYLRLLREALS